MTGPLNPDAARRIARLAALSHHRWSLPVLAELHRCGGGARFVVLVHQLAVSRDSLSGTLSWLSEQQLAIRNPGYGHPLRPEYVLTDAGRHTAAWADRVLRAADPPVADTLLRKWSAAALVAARWTDGRFNAIRDALAVTPRALSGSLTRLAAVHLLTRNARPRQILYCPTAAGDRLGGLLGEVAPA